MESGPPPLKNVSESQNDQIEPVPPPSELASIVTMLTAQQQTNAASTAQVLEQITSEIHSLSTSRSNRPVSTAPAKLPKLPEWADSDADEWVDQAESILSSHGVPRERFSLAIIPALTGKARSAFLTLPAEASTKYDEVEHAILYRLQLTAEEYRRRFRSAAVDHNCSSFAELVLRLKNLFGKWTEQSSVSDFAGLKDLIIRKQLLNTLPVPARQFVNQQGPLDALGTARSADTYLRAQEPPETGVAAALAHRGSSSMTSRPPLDLVRTVAVAVTPVISVLPVTSAAISVADEATSKKYAGLAALQHTLRFLMNRPNMTCPPFSWVTWMLTKPLNHMRRVWSIGKLHDADHLPCTSVLYVMLFAEPAFLSTVHSGKILIRYWKLLAEDPLPASAFFISGSQFPCTDSANGGVSSPEDATITYWPHPHSSVPSLRHKLIA